MFRQKRGSSYSTFILIFVFIKVGIYLFAISNFGFQRDELLHLVLADHLDWGFKEVPPFIAVLAKLTRLLFGDSLFASRIFPTIFAGLVVWLSGMITVELGGKKFAITLVCLALIFSPAFAASGYLFEPVVFDQFWWVLSVWLLLKYCNTLSVKYLYILGGVIGIGLLTKYTMFFFTFSLIIGLLISEQRKMLLNKHVIGAALVAFVIFLPNVFWQFNHQLPVINHMQTLRKEQLNFITPAGFALQQLVVNGIALFLWLTGLIFLLVSPAWHRYRWLAFTFILIFAFYLVMCGKNYYIFGAYPMLFAAGGVVFERWLKSGNHMIRGITIASFTLPNLLVFPIALPVLPLNQTIGVFKAEQQRFPFLNFIVLWDDNKIHPITQNYGDMLGWDEFTAKVAKAWQNLTPEQQDNTLIYADNYGEAGAIDHFGKKYGLPHAVSLNSSFSLWAPETIDSQYVIYVDDKGGENVNKIRLEPESYHQTDLVENPLSVEKGTAILLLTHPGEILNEYYKKELAEQRLH